MAGYVDPYAKYKTPTQPVQNSYSPNVPVTPTKSPVVTKTTPAPDPYADLMAQYQNLLTSSNKTADLSAQYNNLLKTNTTPNPVVPTTAPYKLDPALQSALDKLKNLTATGGYSSGDIADLRARAVSPVRSVYSSAQRNIDRAKTLSGGYSPNYTAATAKLARDQASTASDSLTNANAGIAQNVASNKLGIAGVYSGAAAGVNAARTAVEQNNANTETDTSKFNSQQQTQAAQFDAQTKQSILQSLAELYRSGTGDKLAILNAMKALYGETAGLALQNKSLDNSASSTLINAYR